MKVFVEALIVCIVSLVICALLLHGRYEHLVLSIASGVASAALVASFLVKKKVRHGIIVGASLLLGIGLSYFPGVMFYDSQIIATQLAIEAYLPLLEKSRDLNGVYPTDISTIIDRRELPYLTRNSVFFENREDFYWIYFRDPNSGLNDIFIYDSASRKWDYRLR
jgi:hypothetical protein